jgi:N-formylglutamate deformylase
MTDVYAFSPGEGPILVSSPHDGRQVPDALLARFTPAARELPDTDWHVNELYRFVGELGLPMIRAGFSRYVVDLNRPPDGSPMYPGATPTGVCPKKTFSGEPIYLPGQEPDEEEAARRVDRYWRPYHERIAEELAAMRARYGLAILWDAHSVRSEVPSLFAGRLPELNFGTADGTSCSAAVEALLRRQAEQQDGYSFVFNGRFKGGHITRRHGRPEDGIHAVQLELAQRTYMDEDARMLHPPSAQRLQTFLRGCLEALQQAAPGRP